MLIIRARQNFSGIVSTLLLAILLLAPLVVLHQLLDDLRHKDESYQDLLARERLMQEMGNFQDLLKPEHYIEYALKSMNRDFRFSADTQQERSLSHSINGDPRLITADFPGQMRQYLGEKFGIEPLYIIAADCDLQNIFSSYKRDLFKSKQEQSAFEEAAGFNIFFSEFEPRNELPYTQNLEHRYQEILARHGKTERNIQAVFADYFRKHVSVFTNPPLYPDTCQVFFSNSFGNQRAYQQFHRITRAKGSVETVLGGYYLCINASDIDPLKSLRNALANSTQNTRRHLLRRQIRQPFFARTSNRMLYYSGFSSSFHVAVEDSGIKDQQACTRIRSFLQNHCLVTSIDAKQLQSIFLQAQKATASLIKLAILMLFALGIRTFTGNGQTSIKLSGKLRIAVALIVILPISGFFIVSELIKNSSEKLEIIKYQNIIRQRLGLFEKLISDQDLRLLLMLAESKKMVAATYFSLPNIDMQALLSRIMLKRLFYVNGTFSVDKKGRVIETPGLRAAPDQSKTRSTLFTILVDLAAIDPNAEEAKSLQKQQLLLSSFTDAFTSSYITGANLAREGLIGPNFLTFAPLRRACYQLLSHPDTPDKPEAVLLHETSDVDCQRKVLKQLNYAASQLFSEYSQDCQIDFGVFMRSPSSLRGFYVPFGTTGSNSLRSLAIMAMKQRTSGTSVMHENDQYILNSWVFSDDMPTIITARGKLKTTSGNALDFTILPIFLLLYALLATILLSDLLADIFLAPVNTLLKCVKSIQANHLDVKASISSGDEFSELATSFNRMSEGLCQREKMRRFVSEKLFSSLQSPLAGENAGKVNLSILSSDIRGFTTLSEQYQPEEIVSLLNEYFSLMEKEICKYGGSIEKIVGDAIVAAFYEDVKQEDHEFRACSAARSMKRALHEFNCQRAAQARFTIETGIGIASGEAILGFAGTSKKRREFVLIGDVILNAENLESLTKFGIASRIFMDSSTHELVKMRINSIKVEVVQEQQPIWELANEQ